MVKPTNGHASGGEPTGPARIGDTEWAFPMVHESARISRDAVVGTPGEWRDRSSSHPAIIGEGVIVREFARVHAGCDRATVVGPRSLLMAGSYVGHDSHIGAGCELAPNVVIGGCCTLGDGVRVGMNASVIPHVSIAPGVRIGAGSVVTRDIDKPGTTWVGNPARRIK